MSETLIRLLAELPPAEIDPARAEQIRMGCRARLAQQASALRNPTPRGRTVPGFQALIVVLGVAYLIEVLVQALRVYGHF